MQTDLETITESWLLGAGFRKDQSGNYQLGPYRWRLHPMLRDHYAFMDTAGTLLAVMQNRQDVRNLCAALGSPIEQ